MSKATDIHRSPSPPIAPELGSMKDYRWLYRLARRVTEDPDTAGDLAQEALVLALEQRPRLDDGPRAWFGQVVRTLSWTARRADHRRRRREEESHATAPLQAPSTEDLVSSAESVRRLARALDRLAEPYRSTVCLHFFEGRSLTEIARGAGLSDSTVRWRLQEALRQLRRDLSVEREGAWRRRLGMLVAGAWNQARRGAAFRLAPLLGVAALSVVATSGAPPLVAGGGVEPIARAEVRARAYETTAPAPGQGNTDRGNRLSARDRVIALAGGGLALANPPALGSTAGSSSPAAAACDDVDHGTTAPHPRLLLDRRRLCALRAAISDPGSVRSQVYGLLRAQVDRGDPRAFAPHLSDGWGHLAHAAALVYLLTDQRRYAQIAYDAIDRMYQERGGELRLPDRGEGMARAQTGISLGFVYDWAWTGLTEAQRAHLRARLRASLAAWREYWVEPFAEGTRSSWTPACRATELLQTLALEPADRDPVRQAALIGALVAYTRRTYGTMGLSQEGSLKVAFAGRFLIPAALALSDAGRPELQDALASRKPWRSALFLGSFSLSRSGAGHFLPSGVSGPEVGDAGWISLLSALVPTAERGAYRFFYDRHVGRASAHPADARYEPRRAGRVWALLFYPEDVAATDPARIVGNAAVDDTRGLYVFRNRWNDADDVQISLHGDFARHPTGFDRDEAFDLGLRAFGVTFAGAPGSTGDPARVSGLLVDGRASTGKSGAGRGPGGAGWHDIGPTGGVVEIRGGRKYNLLGIGESRRQLLTDFSGGDGGAVLSTLDRLRSTTVHTYVWQMSPEADAPLRAYVGNESGRSTFTLVSAEGAYLKGWVVHPAGVTLEPALPLGVAVRGSDVDLWIVAVVGRGAAPVAMIEGDGLAARVHLNGATVRHDATLGRLMVDRGGSLPRRWAATRPR